MRKYIIIGVAAIAAICYILFIRIKRLPEPTEQSSRVIGSKFMPNDDLSDESTDAKSPTIPSANPMPAHSPLSGGQNISSKKYTSAKPLSSEDLPRAVRWLSDAEAQQIPLSELRSKAKAISRESFRSRPIRNREEAMSYLNNSFSFTKFPSVAFENTDYFFFSAPLTHDFSSGFSIDKTTGEIATWRP